MTDSLKCSDRSYNYHTILSTLTRLVFQDIGLQLCRSFGGQAKHILTKRGEEIHAFADRRKNNKQKYKIKKTSNNKFLKEFVSPVLAKQNVQIMVALRILQ